MKIKRVPGLVGLGLVLMVSTSAFAQFEALKRFTKSSSETAHKQIAHFKLKGAIAETPVSMPSLFGSEPPVSMKDLLARLKQARQDPNVVAVVLDLQQAALGFAQLEEFHKAVRAFAAVDKEVFVHADSLSTLTYAAATAASRISLVPSGDLWLIGLYSETPYVRGALDKLGITPDFEHCGDYKTGAEPITQEGPSDQSKRMSKWLFDGLYDGLVTLLAEGRGVDPDRMRKLIDQGPYSAEDALAAGLIDSVQHRQDFVADLHKRYGRSTDIVLDYGKKDPMALPTDNMFAFFDFMMKALNPARKEYDKPSVAIVYVEGSIAMGEAQQSPFGGSSGAFSTTIRKALDEAAGDESVKAVVLRVDSPGGSALASEIILDAARRVADRKPLIVSMGNVAASGGYYVTCAAKTVFADRNTITASIGVLGGKLVTAKAWDSIGIHWHPQKRGAMAGMMSTATSFSDQERAKIVKYMYQVYDVFKGHVVDARGSKLAKPIDELAGGRVYTGAQALELGLIDKIGGLSQAVKFAASRAGLGEYDLRVIPEPPTIFDLLFRNNGDSDYVRGAAFSFTELPMFKSALTSMYRVDPLRVKAVLRMLQRIELIHKEGVVMMTPSEWVIR